MSQIDDKVWFDYAHKISAIGNDVAAEIAAGHNVLVLSHFPVSLTRLIRLLSDRNIQHRSYATYDAAQLCEASPGTVWVGLARSFQAPVTLNVSVPTKAPLKILVLEHHPQRSQDQTLLDFAARLSCQPEVCFYSSLDDPLLVHFNGDSIQQLFKRIGIDKSECISHHLVTKAIVSAQEKIESEVIKDLQAESIEDWFKYNIKR